MSKTPNQSIFMQMHNGTRTGEGSFNVGLKELFYIASQQNRRKLVDAFPEFFGDEVPEFGITKKADPKKLKYKGWAIVWNDEEQLFDLTTPDEMEQPAGFREVEAQFSNVADAKVFIDNY
ncbi:MAG: hypothetical protein FWC34_09190 [Bacteroidetes bacterium]|nr:hypothetical protein [Bacteroidota bacterium]MCL2303027.1 hypothetical protein [Lentimicrobiaceae bacterium]